ncbi:hypothetical protein GOQ29_06005 [Clostridium sp. D2Q-14]|nr:hypothetical protein [Anaeromonas gelatinilytica]MBS4535173.1 hypothetical protein [Anaeromonas gelatinilytica]
MDYKKILEEQIKLLVEENEKSVDPEQARKNVETIFNLVIFITNNF